MSTILRRFHERGLARVQASDGTVITGGVGPFSIVGMGVDRLDRLWASVQDLDSGLVALAVFDALRGGKQFQTSLGGDFFYGHWEPDDFGRMWVSNTVAHDLEARSFVDASLVASVALNDGADDFDAQAVLHDANVTPQFVYAAAIQDDGSTWRLFKIVPIPGAEAVDSFGASVVTISGSSGVVTTKLVRDPMNGDFWVADTEDETTVLTFDSGTLAASRVSLATSAGAFSAGGGLRGITYAFGHWWLGTDPRTAGVGPAQLLKCDFLLTNNVKGVLAFDDALYIADVVTDGQYIYVAVVRQVVGVENLDNTIAKVDPISMTVVEEAVTVAAGIVGSTDFLEPQQSRAPQTDLLEARTFSFQYPTSILVEAFWWFRGDDKDTPFGAIDNKLRGLVAEAQDLSAVVVISKESPFFGSSVMRRIISSSGGTASPVVGVLSSKRSLVFGSQERTTSAVMAGIIGNPALPLSENSFLHDGTGMTLVLVFHSVDTAATALLFSTGGATYDATAIGTYVEWDGPLERIRAAISNGSGTFVHEVVSPDSTVLAHRTHILIVRYVAGASPEFTVDIRSTLSLEGGEIEEPRRLGESDTPTGAPTGSDPVEVPTFRDGGGIHHLTETAAFQKALLDREARELFDYLRRWQASWSPENLPDLELWLFGDDPKMDTPLADNGGLFEFLPNNATGPGRTQVGMVDEYNSPVPLTAIATEEPASSTMPNTTRRSLLFDRLATDQLDSGQFDHEFRWLSGGGLEGGGLIAGMTLAWVFHPTNDVDFSQRILLTGDGTVGAVGLTVTWRNGDSVKVEISDGGGTFIVDLSAGSLVKDTTYTCVLRVIFTGVDTTGELRVNGAVTGPTVVATAAVDSDPDKPLRLGGSSTFDGHLGEVVGVRRRLDDDEVTALEAYLDGRWK